MIARRGPIHAEENPALAWERGNETARHGASAVVTSPAVAARPVPAQSRGDEVSQSRRVWLRVLFALDILGAGGPGVLMLAAPDKAGDLLFGGDLTPDAATRVLGCVWIALGLLAVAGMLRPVTFSPVLLLQFGYKLVWLSVVALPAAVAGEPVPPVLAIVSAGWVVAVGIAVPWGDLLRPEERKLGGVPRKPR